MVLGPRSGTLFDTLERMPMCAFGVRADPTQAFAPTERCSLNGNEARFPQRKRSISIRSLTS